VEGSFRGWLWFFTISGTMDNTSRLPMIPSAQPSSSSSDQLSSQQVLPAEPVDLLIVGSGIAGCSAALIAADAGLKVCILTKGNQAGSATATGWAQGGIIYRGENDSPELLADDIWKAGAQCGSWESIRHLAQLGPAYVEELLMGRLNVPFDRTPDDMLDITEEAAHSVRRIVHCADATGREIEAKLVEALRHHKNIRVILRASVIDLLTLSHHSLDPTDVYKPPTCVGVYAYLHDTGQVVPLLAAETLLATGGLGQLFLHSTNPRGARGDGVAMAARAGARLINLEYIQFHPTALYEGAGGAGGGRPAFLITEALRGEGGRLIRRDGSEFMKQYHEAGSLAPRDVVARAIHQEMLNGDEPCVYLDISHRPPDWIAQRFPTIFKRCQQMGIDMTSQPIPVVPAAHYSCGGIAVGLQGETSIHRLRAAGEVACTGVHGANRLASTSLLEGLVWGAEAGKAAIRRLEQEPKPYYPPIPEWKLEKETVDPALIVQDWLTIKYTMWNYVGLVRGTKRMKRARAILRELQTEIEYFYERAALSDEVIGLRNGCQAALAVLHAALENRTSRGGHYRVD
jgi:L-aspartate oxidase